MKRSEINKNMSKRAPKNVRQVYFYVSHCKFWDLNVDSIQETSAHIHEIKSIKH